MVYREKPENMIFNLVNIEALLKNLKKKNYFIFLQN